LKNLAVVGAFAGEVFGMAWLLNAQPASVLRALEAQPLKFLGGFFSGFLLWLIILGLALYLFLKRRDPLDRGFFWSFTGLWAGLLAYPRIEAARVFWLVSGFILILALLQKAYHLTYHDELTRIPARRALNEYLETLKYPYTMAMVDIDHFKKFNDTYGHDVGDQVLKKVAAHIEKVRDGGRAFRYGGEEFAVIFPGKSIDQVKHALEQLRIDIHGDPFIPRSPDRPKKKPEKPKPAAQPLKPVKVTVSIGMAEPSGREDADPCRVLKRADEALYRAKNSGRNCIRD